MPASLIHLKIALVVCFGTVLSSVLLDMDHLPWIIFNKRWDVLKLTYDNEYVPGGMEALEHYDFQTYKFNPIVPLHNIYFFLFCVFLLAVTYYTNQPTWFLFMLGVCIGVATHMIADYRFPWLVDWFHRWYVSEGSEGFRSTGMLGDIFKRIFG